MLSAKNPYMLPGVVAGGVLYLALSALTDLEFWVRLTALVGVAIVLPQVVYYAHRGVNALLGRGGEAEGEPEADEDDEDEAADVAASDPTVDAGEDADSDGADDAVVDEAEPDDGATDTDDGATDTDDGATDMDDGEDERSR